MTNVSRSSPPGANDGLSAEAVLAEFRDAGAVLEGHFILSSGRRSALYLNKALVGVDPGRVSRLAAGLASVAGALAEPPAYVVSPVMGAVVFGFETARQLGLPFFYLERAEAGFALRRGFSLPQGAPVLVVEDIVSTGLSAREAVEAVKTAGGRPLAVACLIDRSAGRAAAALGAPLRPLAVLDVPDYAPDALPPELAAIPPTKPGSRPDEAEETPS